jgi:hypothetical protein
MCDGSRQQGQGITFATNSFTKQDCIFLALGPPTVSASGRSTSAERSVGCSDDPKGIFDQLRSLIEARYNNFCFTYSWRSRNTKEAKILEDKYALKTSVAKAGFDNQ